MPTLFEAMSDCFKYFHPYQSPKGGKNILTEYAIICFGKDTAINFSCNDLPQLAQK